MVETGTHERPSLKRLTVDGGGGVSIKDVAAGSWISTVLQWTAPLP